MAGRFAGARIVRGRGSGEGTPNTFLGVRLRTTPAFTGTVQPRPRTRDSPGVGIPRHPPRLQNHPSILRVSGSRKIKTRPPLRRPRPHRCHRRISQASPGLASMTERALPIDAKQVMHLAFFGATARQTAPEGPSRPRPPKASRGRTRLPTHRANPTRNRAASIGVAPPRRPLEGGRRSSSTAF
jgi:hypothetical protein